MRITTFMVLRLGGETKLGRKGKNRIILIEGNCLKWRKWNWLNMVQGSSWMDENILEWDLRILIDGRLCDMRYHI